MPPTQSLSGLADDITSIAEDLIHSGNFTIPIRDNLVALIDNGVCSSFSTGNNETIDLDSKAEEAVQVLTDLSDFMRSDLVDIKDNFSSRFNIIEQDVNGMLDTAQDYARISYYAIGIISLSSLLYIGAYLAWFGPKWMSLKTYFCFQTYIVLPLYFITLVLTALFTAGIGTTLVVNSGKSKMSDTRIILETAFFHLVVNYLFRFRSKIYVQVERITTQNHY